MLLVPFLKPRIMRSIYIDEKYISDDQPFYFNQLLRNFEMLFKSHHNIDAD